jgi:hypothetical protein
LDGFFFFLQYAFSGAVLSAAFLTSLAAGAREGADMVSNPDERDDWCYTPNSPIVAFKFFFLYCIEKKLQEKKN